jgi:hypothetical protein
MGFGLGVWIYWHLIYTTRNYGQYSTIADLHTFLFTVTYTVWFSVFTSRIMATDFITVCHFRSHMKSSFRSLTPLLPLFWCLIKFSTFYSFKSFSPSASDAILVSRIIKLVLMYALLTYVVLCTSLLTRGELLYNSIANVQQTQYLTFLSSI